MAGKMGTVKSTQQDGGMINSTGQLQTMILTDIRQTLPKVSQLLTNYRPLNPLSAEEFTRTPKTRTMIRLDTLDKTKRQ